MYYYNLQACGYLINLESVPEDHETRGTSIILRVLLLFDERVESAAYRRRQGSKTRC